MRRALLALVAIVLLQAGLTVPGSAQTSGGAGSAAALVQLRGDPLTVAAETRPAPGRRIDFASSAVRAERARLAATRNDFRAWLRQNAPNARITSEVDIALHAVVVTLNGTTLSALRSAPMVVAVELDREFRPVAHDDPDLSLIRANEGWTAAGGMAAAGAGVKVAVIDSGIDITHPCFSDAGYPAQARIGDTALTNNKVIAARVFHNQTKKNKFDARAVGFHGTHVAGTVACNAHTPAVINGVVIPYDPSGVAPRALLGNYNVFPGETGSARSEDILNALEAAYVDGFDVANMSLGGARNDGGGAFLLDNAIDNLDRANMVVAVAAGNEGPGYFTVHYPGAAPRALTAGASTVGHNVINQVVVDGKTYAAVIGDFGELSTDLTAPLKVVADPSSEFPHDLDVACDGGSPLPSLSGTIALLGRGTCDFTVKMRNAQNAGAVGVIMVNREDGPPFVMAHNELETKPTIPGVMVSLADGAVIDDHDGEPATLNHLGAYVTTPADRNLMAGFSSWGPTHGDLLIKPDVVAPGADVISAFPAHTCSAPPCWSFLGGTSMATPHLAGAAAVVRGLRPGWTAAQVRSAVVNTAQQGVLRHPDTGVVTNDPLIVGSGLADLAAATRAVAALDPVSAALGKLASGSGGQRTTSMTVTNLTTTTRSFTVAVADDGADGVTFATTGGTFTLAPGASQAVALTVTAAKNAADGHRFAQVNVSSEGVTVAHAALYTLVGEGDAAPGKHMAPPPFA